MSDVGAKLRGLELLMLHQTGRRFTIDAGMASSVAVIRVTVPDFTAKARPRMGR